MLETVLHPALRRRKGVVLAEGHSEFVVAARKRRVRFASEDAEPFGEELESLELAEVESENVAVEDCFVAVLQRLGYFLELALESREHGGQLLEIIG